MRFERKTMMIMKKRAISILLIGMMLFGLFGMIPVSADTAEGTIDVGFTSDVHAKTDYLNSWLTAVTNEYTLDSMVYCGDFGDHNAKTIDAYAQPFTDIIVPMNNALKRDGKIRRVIYTSGNHEFQFNQALTNGAVPEAFADEPDFCRIGAAVSEEDNAGYIIYCLGAAGYFGGDGGFPDQDIDLLDQFLQTAPGDIPIFVVSHFPLHYYHNGSSGRTIYNAEAVIDTLNRYAADHQLCFIWGHNHSKADPLYGKIIGRGGSCDRLRYTSSLSKEIGFTYAAAGGLRNEASAGETNYSGLVTSIDTVKKNITFRYYRRSTGAMIGEPVTVFYGGFTMPKIGAVYEQYTGSTITDGDYLIVSANREGDAFAAQKDVQHKSFISRPVHIDGEKHITLDAADAADLTWNISSYSSGYNLYHGGDFLEYASSSGISYVQADTARKTWSYAAGSSQLSMSSGFRRGYLRYSGGNFTVSTTSGSVYLFKKVEEIAPPLCTITWKNDDGSVIDTTTVAYGEIPTHDDPEKSADEQYTYTFTGWTPEIEPATGDAEYTATFEAKKIVLLGDPDGDGSVSAIDSAWIQRRVVLMNVPEGFNEAAADVDGDGDITNLDATWILRYIVLLDVPYPINTNIACGR